MISLDRSKDIRQGEELDLNALNSYFNKELGELAEIKQYPGGFSNLTFEIINTQGKSYVLRKAPKGAKAIKGGHDMAREFNILQNLKASNFNKIPNPILLCEDEKVIGSTFYVMEQVQGIILRAQSAAEIQQTLSENEISEISKAICEQQAALHLIDISKSELKTIGKPEGYVRRQVGGWTGRYLSSATHHIPQMVDVFHWLENKMPPESKNVSLIHNDFKYDNIVLNPDKLNDIKAILDWEMTTIGDPLMDLGSTLAYWVEEGDSDFARDFNPSWLPGNLTRLEYVQLYTQLTGFDTSDILFYYVFGLFKNAVIIQQIFHRYHNGLTSDPRFANLNFIVELLAKKAVRSIESGEMV